MIKNVECENQLETLLANSFICLRELECGRFEDIKKLLSGQDQGLMSFMQAIELKDLPAKQQEKLYKILNNRKSAISLISDRKQQLAKKMAELRNGRNLARTYNKL